MKAEKLLGIITIALLSMFVVSCDNTNKKSTKVRSIGNTSEILIVLQNDDLKESIISDEIKKYFSTEQYGLSQSEPLFDVAFITVNTFSEMFKKHRNILIVTIDKKVLTTKVESFKDRWSSPQQIYRITSPSAAEFISKFPEYADEMISNFSIAERQRILSIFRPGSKNDVLKEVRKVFNLDITIPQGFYVAKTEPQFMWIRKEVQDYSQGIVIISEPYEDQLQFSKESIVARTNRDLKQFIPGESEGTYMAITGEFIEPQLNQVDNFISEYAVEMRGVWNVEHDFMGGPFVSYTFVDPGNNQILTIIGYVYHPNKKKRNLLRQLEAIIYSVKYRNL
jgi:uncharacterized protein DUF4837